MARHLSGARKNHAPIASCTTMCAHNLIRVPLAPWTSGIVTAAPVRGSLPDLSDRARLHRECPTAQLVLSEWNPQMAVGVKKGATRVPFCKNSQDEKIKRHLSYRL